MKESSMAGFHRSKWIRNILIFLLITIVLSVTLFIIQPANQNSYMSAIIDKHSLLDSTASPRIIVVGGSNIAFGLDSKLLSQSLDLPVINAGLHAGFGLRFILNDLEPYIQSGDIILLSPEYYNFFNDNLEGEVENLSLLLEAYPAAIKSFDLPQFIKLPDILLSLIRQKIFRFTANHMYHIDTRDPIYARNGFNQFGDVVSHLKYSSSVDISNKPYITLNDTYNQRAFIILNRFARQAEQKGAKVLFIYPAARSTNCIATQPLFENFENTVRNNLEFPILSNTSESCLENKLFFDSVYHLNKEGRNFRTLQLINILRDYGY